MFVFSHSLTLSLPSPTAVRILEYSIDPHTVRGINSVIGDEVLFELPIVFWIASALLLQLYWY